MSVREYQLATETALSHIYNEVVSEWRPFPGKRGIMYAPEPDIAVGPFAIEGRYGERYSRLLEESRAFIECLIAAHNINFDDELEKTSFRDIFFSNENARCLLCIEIENTGSKKHCLGDLVNASALGRIGLLIAWTPNVLSTFVRQRKYLAYLASVEKNSFKTDNVLVLTREQFDTCLATALKNQ